MRKVSTPLLAIFAGSIVSVHAQGTFRNLDFEEARVILSAGNVASSNALPGWIAYSNSTELASVPYNLFLRIPTVGLYGSNSYVLAGNFSAWIAGYGSISQAGTVPADAHSLIFTTFSGGLPLVTLGGQALSCIMLSNAPLYSVYGADVSPFAGQSAILSFSLAPDGGTSLDDIQFSPALIPEPCVAAILGVGALLLGVRRQQRHVRAGPRFRCRARGRSESKCSKH